MKEKIKNNAIDILNNIKEVEFAYLFGSYANGTQSSNSDIDIAIFVKDGYNLLDTHLKTHHKLEIDLNKEIDIVILNNAKNFYLVKDILKDGILLKDTTDDHRAMYEVMKMHEMIDYFNFKRMIDVA